MLVVKVPVLSVSYFDVLLDARRHSFQSVMPLENRQSAVLPVVYYQNRATEAELSACSLHVLLPIQQLFPYAGQCLPAHRPLPA